MTFLCFSTSAFAQAPTKPDSESTTQTTRSKAGVGTYQIVSATKGISVIKDGILAGGPGTNLNGRIGINEIIVSAPNHAQRKVRFWIKPGESKSVNIELSSLAEPQQLNWKPSYKKFPKDALRKKASFCKSYQEKTKELAFCDRKTLLDDILYADDSLFHIDDMRAYQSHGSIKEFRDVLAKFERSETTEDAEALLAKYPDAEASYHLVALQSLLKGDCPRIQGLNIELSQFKGRKNPTLLPLVICAEAQNDKKGRDQILATALKSKTSSASLHYWAGLIEIDKNPTRASEIAINCLKAHPDDTRCNELLNMSLKLQDKQTKSSTNDFEDPIFKNFLAIEDRLPKGQYESLYFDTASIISQYPLALEPYLSLAWLNASRGKEFLEDDYIRLMTKVASIHAGGTLDKIVESIEKANLTELLPQFYQRRLIFSPGEPNLWYRLVRSYAKANMCPELLKASDEGAAYLPKFNPSLLQMRGSCEMELQRFAKAAETYKKVMDVNPKVWSSPYNLANAYERLEKKTEAYAFFKKALELNPPEDVKSNIEARLKFLEPAAGNLKKK